MDQSNIFRVSPLAHYADVSNQGGVDGRSRVILEELAFCVHLNLRCDPSDSQTLTAASTIFGVGLPLVPNTFHEASDIRIHWLGPDEWLLVTTDEMKNETLLKLNGSLKSYHVQVLDISDAKAVIGLTGKDARDLLMKGCPVDLHEREFHSGCSTRTLLGKVEVIIHQVSDRPEYDIYVHRSFSEFLWDWLEDAAQEFASSTFRS